MQRQACGPGKRDMIHVRCGLRQGFVWDGIQCKDLTIILRAVSSLPLYGWSTQKGKQALHRPLCVLPFLRERRVITEFVDYKPFPSLPASLQVWMIGLFLSQPRLTHVKAQSWEGPCQGPDSIICRTRTWKQQLFPPSPWAGFAYFCIQMTYLFLKN